MVRTLTAEQAANKLAYDAKWRSEHRVSARAASLAWYHRNKKRIAAERREDPRRNKRLRVLPPLPVATLRGQRELAIHNYGGCCVCCGETTYEFLTLDHVNNDGTAHRKLVGGTGGTLRWAIRNNYPATLQLLCWNCNAAKAYHGVCPHKRVHHLVAA